MRTLHGWKDACRLFWSVLWRQFLALTALSLALGLIIALLQKLRLLSYLTVVQVLPYCTTTLFVASCLISFRYVLNVYDVRMPGGPVEQDRRHRR